MQRPKSATSPGFTPDRLHYQILSDPLSGTMSSFLLTYANLCKKIWREKFRISNCLVVILIEDLDTLVAQLRHVDRKTYINTNCEIELIFWPGISKDYERL